MGGGPKPHSVDVLRKSVIVAILIGAMWLLHRFAVPAEAFDPRGLLALGFVILAAYTVGELAETINLPHITGYLIAGLLLGPSIAEQLHHAFPGVPPPFDHGILNAEVQGQLVLLDDLALALIALTAGGELRVEALRKGLRTIVGILVLQGTAIAIAITAFVWAISGVIPAIALPQLAAVPTTSAVLALGAVVAAIAFATSPAATIAIINGTRSRGPMTSNVLSVVVLKDVFVVVAFSAATAVATAQLGIGSDGGFLLSLLHIAGSMLLGALLGGGIWLYLATVGAEILVFLVGVIYTATFVAHAFHGEAALVFIVAGFVVANFDDLFPSFDAGDQGERLIHEVERLAQPVYVVFFTLAGAKLHLDVLASLAGFAIALSLVRVAAIVIGTRLGASLTQADPATRSYGWMGFVSQAGLAITLANSVANTYGDGIGEGLFALILGGVAINEVAGPVLLQFGLGLANEHDAASTEEETSEASEPEPEPEAPEPWSGEEIDGDPWGPPLSVEDAALERLVSDVEAELKLLARDVARSPMEEHATTLEGYVRSLRREYLRFHRRMQVRIQTDEALGPMPTTIRGALSDLGERWRDRVLDRAAAVQASGRWNPVVLVEPIDALAGSLPESMRVPVLPATVEPREEAMLWRSLRTASRIRSRMGRYERHIIPRDLAGFHLSGRLPTRLEGVAAVLVRGDLHLATRTSTLFQRIAQTYTSVSDQISDTTPQADAQSLLATARVEIEEEFDLVLLEASRIASDAGTRTAVAIGSALGDLKADLTEIGTLDLPLWRRRYSRVLADRTRGLDALDEGWRDALELTGARYAALALELELVGLEGRVLDAVEMHAGQLARLVRGRGPTQLRRVVVALNSALSTLGVALTEAEDGATLRERTREALDGVSRLLADALRSTRRLEEDLADDVYVTPLVAAVLHTASSLTDWYTVPSGRIAAGEWTLPEPLPTQELAFRDDAVAYLESAITRHLVELTTGLNGRIGSLTSGLEDLERILSFNLELASSELELIGDGPVPTSTRELVQEMLLGAVGRSLKRVDALAEESEAWPEETRAEVHHAVVGELETLRSHVLDGDLGALRRVADRRDMQRMLERQADRWSRVARASQRGLAHTARRTLGSKRVDDWRAWLGVPDPTSDAPLSTLLAPPAPRVTLPGVYARLFSRAAFEAGDLSPVRQAEIHMVRDSLTHTGAVAVVSWDETSALGVIAAGLRACGGRAARHVELDGPVTAAEVEQWFQGTDTAQVLVVHGSRWLSDPGEGGTVAADTLAAHLLHHETPVVLMCDPLVWSTFERFSPLGAAVSSTVRLEPLDVDALRRALLARHSMSGYTLSFDDLDDSGMLPGAWLGRREEGGDSGHRAWFERLHSASGGLLADALRLWTASIRAIDESEGTVHMGPVTSLQRSSLTELPLDTQVLLLHVIRLGWTTARHHAASFGLREGRAEAELVALTRDGLLQRTDDSYHVPSHLQAPLARLFDDQGWT